MKTYTIAEISRRIDVPESTLRYRSKLFRKFIPTVGRGRRKRFEECSLGRLKQIDKYFSEGMNTDDIVITLEKSYGPEITLEDSRPKETKTITKKEVVKMQEKVDIEIIAPMLKIIENQEVLIRELRTQNRLLSAPKKRSLIYKIFG